MSLSRNQALVAGGTEAIGRAVVRRLAREGHAVIAIHGKDDSAREEAAREFADAHLDVVFEEADLAKPSQVVELFKQLTEKGRSPALLVNAGGLDAEGPTAFLEVVDFDAVLDVNLRATFLTCQQAVKAMAPRRFGRIINFVSPAALQGGEGLAADAAARAGVLGLTRALAREVGPLGITVNAVCPGAIATTSTAATRPLLEARIRRTPLRRAGTPDEVAGLVNMLCEDGAGYITGQCLSIDGGLV